MKSLLMKTIKKTIIIILSGMLFMACQKYSYKQKLDFADSFVANDPHQALVILDSIPEQTLNSLDWSYYTFIKTKAIAKTSRNITWPEEMHRAALTYENESHPLDKTIAADYYYFSALSYKWNNNIPAAIVDWLKCVDLLKDKLPNQRLYFAFESLYMNYSNHMMTNECEHYALKLLQTARELNDTAKIVRGLNFVATQWIDSKPIDSTLTIIDEAINISKIINDSSMIAWSFGKKARLLSKYDILEEALFYGDSAIIYSPDNNLSIINDIGYIKYKQKQYPEAVQYLEKSYQAMNLSGKYWTSRFLFDISKQPGYEHLAHYGDSVIYYNQKFDHEEQSGNIEKAIADYKQQRQQEMYHQMIKSFAVAAVIVLMILGISYGWKTWRAKRRIDQLQMLLQEQKAKEISSTEPVDPAELLKQQKESLRLHRELFATTETYRRLQLLEEMKSGEVVNNQMREKLVNQVLAGFYDPIRSLMEGSQFSHEDLFLCLMFYMKFRTRDVAAVLGVSEDAIRKRKSRVRQRMEEVGVELFNEE